MSLGGQRRITQRDDARSRDVDRIVCGRCLVVRVDVDDLRFRFCSGCSDDARSHFGGSLGVLLIESKERIEIQLSVGRFFENQKYTLLNNTSTTVAATIFPAGFPSASLKLMGLAITSPPRRASA
jgi:hypothetical protein